MIHWTLAIFILLVIISIIFWIRVFRGKDAAQGVVDLVISLGITLSTFAWMNITEFNL